MRLYNIVNREVLKEKMLQSEEKRTTISFYKYFHIAEPKVFRDELFKHWAEIAVFGRVYVSYEGINAQISVPTDKFEQFKTELYTIPDLNHVRLNVAVEDDGKSFYKLTIKVREKILADGLNDATFDVTKKGIHVDAEGFNELAADPETVIIDMRNHYETEIGHFKGAITPDVETFRESLPIIEEMLADKKDKNLLMYCTGGIRCEKASAYFKHKGFKHVFQLNGGIIQYAQQVKAKGLENRFVGKNFVFDERLAEGISTEVISECHQCGAPADKHTNCANEACHLLFIQCAACAEKMDKCCSTDCKDFIKLPKETQIELRKTQVFNGTHFSKNRYSRNKLYMNFSKTE
jgi:UPF0176 protein